MRHLTSASKLRSQVSLLSLAPIISSESRREDSRFSLWKNSIDPSRNLTVNHRGRSIEVTSSYHVRARTAVDTFVHLPTTDWKIFHASCTRECRRTNLSSLLRNGLPFRSVRRELSSASFIYRFTISFPRVLSRTRHVGRSLRILHHHHHHHHHQIMDLEARFLNVSFLVHFPPCCASSSSSFSSSSSLNLIVILSLSLSPSHASSRTHPNTLFDTRYVHGAFK